jgi:hypothetical protein
VAFLPLYLRLLYFLADFDLDLEFDFDLLDSGDFEFCKNLFPPYLLVKECCELLKRDSRTKFVFEELIFLFFFGGVN